MLMPSIFASAMLVFATSLDDFVVSQFLFGDASNATVPIKLYNAVRNSPTPALNALATLLLVASFLALILAYVGLRRTRRRGGEVGPRGPGRPRLTLVRGQTSAGTSAGVLSAEALSAGVRCEAERTRSASTGRCTDTA